MFTASTNTENFKLGVILKNGVCALRLVCLSYGGQGACLYVHMPL